MSDRKAALRRFTERHSQPSAAPSAPVTPDTAVPAGAPVPSNAGVVPPIGTASPPAQPQRTHTRAPAVGSLARTLNSITGAAEEARALVAAGDKVVELDPRTIDESIVTDRLEIDSEEQRALVEAIRTGGQRVPILVRPHPEKPNRYQIAYGRRRLQAAIELGRPVRAVIHELTDSDLVIAQGQENSARLDLSFIEKVGFAMALEDRGFERDVIMAALTIDRTMASRMLALGRRIPKELIELIGPAPKAGRPRWTQLADLVEKARDKTLINKLAADPSFRTADTDLRFAKAIEACSPKKKKPSPSWISDQGRKIALIERTSGKLKVTIDEKIEPEFADYVVARLRDLYREFRDVKPPTDS